MDHLEGIFYVLIAGIIFALLYGIVDIIRNIRKKARNAKVIKRHAYTRFI